MSSSPPPSSIDKFTSRAIAACLALMAFAAPISIAGTQAAWALGLLFWIIRLIAVRPRPKLQSMDIAVGVFVGLTLVSSVFSYEPAVSLRKMVTVSLVTIVYVVATNVKDGPTVRRMIVLLLGGCFIACTWTFITLAVGKNLKVTRLAAESPLRNAGIQENDTILTANGAKIDSIGDLDHVFAVRAVDTVTIETYRHELINKYKVPNPDGWYQGVASLGILEHARGRDTRASGFFGHYVTFAEALQLLASLGLAVFILIPAKKLAWPRIVSGVVVAAALIALFLSVTRASWLSFLVSAFVITLCAASRRTLLIGAAIMVPLVVGGLFYLQQKRQVGFLDAKDDSTTWRTMVWREGFNVLTSRPRHMLVGIGMDSLKTHWEDWGMFDNGRQPIGHMHSDYLQMAFERGIPTLIAWLFWMFLYLRMLWRGIRDGVPREWYERALLVGAFGGTIGFLASGVVHYNWGDSEDVMILYILMGLAMAVLPRGNSNPEAMAQ